MPAVARDHGRFARVITLDGSPTIEEFSYSEYTQLRSNNRSLVSVVASSAPQSFLCILPGGKPEDAEVAHGRLVSGDYFPGLGVNPVLGRLFEENEPGVVVSYSFWQRRLHADSSMLSRGRF